LRPPALDRLGLPAALEELARHIEPRAGCPIIVQACGYIRGNLALGAEQALYRIAREALNNCARHAGASKITVLLRLDRREATVAIRDDGMGFAAGDRAAEGDGAHLGLLEMRECARAWGGTLTIESLPEQGATVRAVLPCAPKEAVPS